MADWIKVARFENRATFCLTASLIEWLTKLIHLVATLIPIGPVAFAADLRQLLLWNCGLRHQITGIALELRRSESWTNSANCLKACLIG